MPKISIVLPSYNGERYIAQSIQSIIDQTEKDWELIIVNDCSTDGTLGICNEFAEKDKRIKIISNAENKKLPASLNVGFSCAGGKYLTWTSDDNYYRPSALKMLAEYLDKNPKTDLISMGFDCVDENDVFMYSFESHFKYKRCQQALLTGCNVGAAFMYRKTIADKVGEYDTGTFCAEDYDYWCRIALEGQIDYTTDNVYVYRSQPNSLSFTKRAQVQEKTKYIQHKYAEGFFEKFNFTPADRVKFCWQILHKVDPKHRFRFFGMKLRCFIIRLLSCLIFYPASLRREIRGKLLACDKFSFSRPNEEYLQ